jgi:hypothetical protein
MATVEDILEERAWRDRNGLDDLAWNPDEVAPPFGDVYMREERDHRFIGELAKLAFLVAFLLLAAFMWVL